MPIQTRTQSAAQAAASVPRSPTPVAFGRGITPLRRASSATPSEFAQAGPSRAPVLLPTGGEGEPPIHEGSARPIADPEVPPGGGDDGGGDDGGGDPAPNPDHSDSDDDDDGQATLATALLQLSKSIRKRDSPSEKARAREPDTFDGSDPRKLQPFLLQCILYFRSNRSTYSTGTAKVNFALSFLRDTALQWFEPALLEYDVVEPWMNSWEEFILELKINFGSIDPIGDAEADLDNIAMRENQKILKYNVEFNKLSARVRWGDSALRYKYYKGLPDRIKDVLAQNDKPRTLAELKGIAQSIDARYWERNREKTRNEKSSAKTSDSSKKASQPSSSSNDKKSSSKDDNKASSSKTSSDKPAVSDKIGKDGKLTKVERQRRFDNNLCMFCGGVGHRAKDCPKSSKTTPQVKARAATLDASDSTPSESKN